MSGSDEHAIVVESLTKDYDDLRAVNEVSFTVTQGEVFAFLGPNGAGKTTTVEIIETIRTPTSGKVSVLGMDVASRKREIIPRIGVLPQGFNSFDRITVAESIRYYSRLFGRKATDVDGLMDLTDLREKRDVQFKNLSGGLKQRLGIAIALVNDPEVVFLDEPTTGLDPHARRSVWDVLQGLKRKGKTVFLTTHYMEEAELLADTVAIISKGRIVELGSPNELIDRHANYLCLTLKAADASVLATVKRMGFEPMRNDAGAITLHVQHTTDVQEILGAITLAGTPLPGLEVRRPSLEEVFLELTDEEQTSGAVAHAAGGGTP
jgi:ABC-2 type transport system ATP-binding protein